MGSGVINYAVAGLREHYTREDMVITACFILSGNLSFGTAYIFLKAKLIEALQPKCTCESDARFGLDYDIKKIEEQSWMER